MSEEQPGRYQRSASGMAGALLVTLLVIAGYVAFRAFNRQDLDVKPQRVDYLAQVGYAQGAGSHVVYPSRLPSGWYATQVTLTAEQPPGLQLSMLTPAGQYAGFVSSPQSTAELVSTYVDPHAQESASVTIPGALTPRWQTWTDGSGDTALVAQLGHGTKQQSLLVFGTVSATQLRQLAGSLTTAEVASG